MSIRPTFFHLDSTNCPINLTAASDPLLSKDNEYNLPTGIIDLWLRAQAQGMPCYPVVLALTMAEPLLYDGTNLWTKLQFDSTEENPNPLEGMVKALPGGEEIVKYGVFVLPCYTVKEGELKRRDETREIPAYQVTTTDPETLRMLFEEACNPYLDIPDDSLHAHVEPLANFVNKVKILSAQQVLLNGEFAKIFGKLDADKLTRVKKVWRLSIQERNKQMQSDIAEAAGSIQSLQAALSKLTVTKERGTRSSSTASYSPSPSSDFAEEGIGITSPPSKPLES